METLITDLRGLALQKLSGAGFTGEFRTTSSLLCGGDDNGIY